MLDAAAYGGLFLAAFIAATLLPAQSETVLAGLLIGGRQSAGALIAVASIGNVLGSVVNWALGRLIERFRDRRWFPASSRQLETAQNLYQRWGYWSLLASWVPIVGDPLTVIAGVLKEPLWRFVLIVSLAKVGRYLVLAAATLAWFA
jgi:membrane protein YqaA with SNARE-associated domain